jgi:predicted kinase
MAKLIVMVGLPASGKTTRARQLETELRALRLTPDEWMIPLFDDNLADGRRDILEGRFIALAMSGLRCGTNVILDFGVWSRNERSALRCLALEQGAQCELIYAPVDHDEQLRRVAARSATDPNTTFVISEEDLVAFRKSFQEPDREELTSDSIDAPPEGFANWQAWTSSRWPTSLDG